MLVHIGILVSLRIAREQARSLKENYDLQVVESSTTFRL